jgi:indolepyruvate ferredoxin oxidoreductase beta subunit
VKRNPEGVFICEHVLGSELRITSKGEPMKHQNAINFILAGVGGQGTILASDLLAQVGLESGYDVKQAEVHGMAQRGGSVSSHVRWGPVIHSPLIARGTADVLLAFEQVEAVRALPFLRPGGIVLVNQQMIAPITVSAGSAVYPPQGLLAEDLARVTPNVYWVPALEIARNLGNDKVANVVMLGALSAVLEVASRLWLKCIESRVPARYLELNRLAFRRGRELFRQDEELSLLHELAAG